MQQNKKKNTNPGFTLLEILIATGIFAIVMVITVGIVSQSAGFQSKIRAQRQTYEEVRRLSDQISQDIRSASVPGTVIAELNPDPSKPVPIAKFKGGLVLAQCLVDENSLGLLPHDCTIRHSSIVQDPAIGFAPAGTEKPLFLQTDLIPTSYYTDHSLMANTLLIFTKDKKMIVYAALRTGVSPDFQYKLYYKKISLSDVDQSNGASLLSDDYTESGIHYNTITERIRAEGNDANMISSSDLDVMLQFGGYAPGYLDGGEQPDQQAYISFRIVAETKGYAGLNVLERGLSFIKTTVTSRNYSN
jgi:prepilin-type N-terminal cleavage/methylation domain-containing protein